MRKWILVIAVVLALSACHRKQSWRERTVDNLDLIHAHILTESPGPVDPNNPDFINRMNDSYHKALQMAKQVKNYNGYYAVLNYFISSFQDWNIYFTDFPDPEPTYYPGFVMKYNGKQAVVSRFGYLDSKKGLPPIGAVLKGCGNETLRSLMNNNIFPFWSYSNRIQADWYYDVPLLFMDYENPFITIPKHCEFSFGGHEKTYTLSKYDVSKRVLDHYYSEAAFSYKPKVGLSYPQPGMAWINWPTFTSRDNQTVWEMKKIIKVLPSLRNKPVIVIDLRGSKQDGADQWMQLLLQGIYGKAYYHWKTNQFAPIVYQYRVSQYAINTMETIKWYAHNVFGYHSVTYEGVANEIQHLKASFERGDQLYPENIPQFVAPTNLVEMQPLFAGKLDLVVDGRCNNKCLDFIELAKHFPHVQLLGKQTGANTPYVQSIAPIYIDSGVGLHFGIAIQHNRQRAINKPYYPDHFYSGDINNTKALQQWVAKQ